MNLPEVLTLNGHAYSAHLDGEVARVKIASADRPCT